MQFPVGLSALGVPLAAVFVAVLAAAATTGQAPDVPRASEFTPSEAGEEPAEFVRLDAQKCNAVCQERFTECLLLCDGNNRCMQGCKETNARCVEVCSRLPDAPGTPPSGAPSGSGSAPMPSGTVSSPPPGAPPPGTPAPSAPAPAPTQKPAPSAAPS